jgi:hypothetical protein
MAITYKPMRGFPGIKTPVLHRVTYGHTTDGVYAAYQRSYQDHLVDEWLKYHCQGTYYHSPGWMKQKFIEFEDDQDAVIFALRWAKATTKEV